MDPVIAYLERQRKPMVQTLRRFVECESPTSDPAAVRRFAGLVADEVSGEAKTKLIPGAGGYGPHLQCEFNLGGRKKPEQILVLGHLDTVWPNGVLRTMPFKQAGGRLWGPGVLDMKGGIAMFLYALRAAREAGVPVRRKILLQLNSDEETGSHSSRPLTEKEARHSAAVLVLEPGTGLEGKLKTARKGGGVYRLKVIGRASHAGVDFPAGASAILELARQLEKIAGFTDLENGITVNPGVIAGGTRPNVVAAEAFADIDFRVPRLRDSGSLDRKFRKLRPMDRRCSLELTGGLNRPPMERSPAIAKLFRTAQVLGAQLGFEVEESSTGGGSDGNFTAALGVPTLDGLGAAGEGAHAANESILLEPLVARTALLAKLLGAI